MYTIPYILELIQNESYFSHFHLSPCINLSTKDVCKNIHNIKSLHLISSLLPHICDTYPHRLNISWRRCYQGHSKQTLCRRQICRRDQYCRLLMGKGHLCRRIGLFCLEELRVGGLLLPYFK